MTSINILNTPSGVNLSTATLGTNAPDAAPTIPDTQKETPPAQEPTLKPFTQPDPAKGPQRAMPCKTPEPDSDNPQTRPRRGCGQ